MLRTRPEPNHKINLLVNGLVTLPSSVASTTKSEPKLPTRCGGQCSPGLCKAFELDGCRRVIPPCTRSSWGVASRPVSNVLSTRIPVPSGRGRLRRSGPPRPGTDRRPGHGEAVTASCKLPLLAHHGVSDLHHSQVPPRHAGAVRPWRIAGSLARRSAVGDSLWASRQRRRGSCDLIRLDVGPLQSWPSLQFRNPAVERSGNGSLE
jgi:hypothetical protein